MGITSVSIKRRWTQHLCDARNGSDLPFHRAIRKYGADAFQCEVIASGVSLDAAKALEVEWIAGLETRTPHGYNVTSGGEGTSGTPDVGARISASLTGRTKSPETIERMRKAARLRMTRDARAHLSAYWRARGGIPRG